MYRLSTGKSANKADGISNAIDERNFTRHGQSDMVLLTGYGKRVLGCGDDGTSKKYFRIHYAIGLFECLRIPFGLKNAPQIYQRLIYNALYEYLNIGADPDAFSMESSKEIGVFTEGEPDTSQTPSVLGRRSYIDDILIPATSWTALYERVEGLLLVCDKWNLSISLTKSVWGRRKVDYLGHQVSLDRLEAQPKELGSLVISRFL